ncbi:hypothetical protein [Megasphaera sp. UBA4382]|uniref:hypothetical protein n=1 Tax=Megasphaera sp. UBA4382 TaxID=1946850 RepID=UPI0025C37E7F|nr:hypothetical protein [Megasphaera sp. UBA4382]
MKRQAFQPGEIRDENDAIIREGAYGKKSAFATADNKGILDYMINNFDALFDMISGACVYVDELPTSGDTDKLYVVKSTGKTYRWDGKQFILVSEAVNGLSAYEIAKQNGFTGTEKEWLESIRGEKGEGITGATVDSDGYLILTLGTDTTIKTALKPLVDAKQYADNAAASATQAGESEANAATSLSQVKASALQASDSATAAANSATAAANSAKEQQADWNVTDTTSKAFIKNKPTKWNVLDLTKPLYKNDTLDYTTRPLIDTVRANKLAFLPAEQIIIEQTIDGGQTWTDAGFQDAEKENLFNKTIYSDMNIPKIDGKENAQCGLRVTITAMKYNVPDGTAETDKYKYWGKDYIKSTERYCSLEELYIWCTGASNKIKVKVESATGNNPDAWVTQFSSDSFGLTGGPGGNYIRLGDGVLFGGYYNQPYQFWNYRFTFMTTSRDLTDQITEHPESTQSIININGYGSSMWVAPNRLAFNDHLYYWDNKQNATFPANINAKGKLLENGQSITDSIAKQITTNALTATDATFTGITSVPTANQGNSSNTIASTEFVAKSISALVNGAPEQLNTLNELATALGNDSNFSATVTAELGKKANAAEVESTYAKKTDISNTYIISATEPKSPQNGCLWFDTTNMLIKLRASNAWKTFGAVYLS